MKRTSNIQLSYVFATPHVYFFLSIGMLKMILKNKRFTLIELLVVLAILGVLASLLSPALKKTKASANEIFCKNNLKQLNLVSQQYLDDWNGHYIWHGQVLNTRNHRYRYIWWSQFYGKGDDYPYSMSKTEQEMLVCPLRQELFPSSKPHQPHNYGMNGYLIGRHSSIVKYASKMIVFGGGFDHAEDSGWPGGAFYSYSINGRNRLGGPAQFIHNGQKVYIFADGHAEAIIRSEAKSSKLWDPSL